MVNNGPSVGCQKCRERRIKCDGKRPMCRRCVIRGYACPGYQDVCGVVFKDVTRQVWNKETTRARFAELAASSVVTIQRQELSLKPQVVSVGFFYHQFVLPARRDPSPTTGFFEYILPLYDAAAPSSALHLAVLYMTARAISLYHRQEALSPWHIRTEVAAVEAIRAAISDPRETLRDETLLAVLCMGFVRFLTISPAARDDARVHFAGALALIRHRGPGGFDSKIAHSLLAATRSNILLQSLWFQDDAASQDLVLLLPNIQPRDSNPAVTIHYLLARVLSLQRRMIASHSLSLDEKHQSRSPSSTAIQAQVLGEELVSWRRNVPPEWEILALSRRSQNIPCKSDYLPIEMAYVFGQWHCTYLLALRLEFAAIKREATGDEMYPARTLQGILDRTQQLVDSLLFSVLPFFSQTDAAYINWTGPVEDTPNSRDGNTESRTPNSARTPHRRPYLLNLLDWALIVLMGTEIEEFDGFGVQLGTMQYLAGWRQIVADTAWNETADRIHSEHTSIENDDSHLVRLRHAISDVTARPLDFQSNHFAQLPTR